MNNPTDFPADLLPSLEKCTGFEPHQFIQSHEQPTPVSIRLNPNKATQLDFELADKVPWARYGHYLAHRKPFILDPLWHAGAYYVQEASSMFLEQAVLQHVDVSQPIRALDMCAAPGGKSTHLHSLLHPESLLVANEVVNQRCSILEENLTRWSGSNMVIAGNAPEKFSSLPGYFQLVMVDAPCSGSGLFRKDPAAMEEWSLAQVNKCVIRQKDILKHAITCLSPGGLLIYSTCSYSEAENEAITKWCIEQGLHGLKVEHSPLWNIVESPVEGEGYGYRFYPYRLQGEGFYLSIFRKPDGKVGLPASKLKLTIPPKSTMEILQPWLPEEPGKVFQWKENLFFAGGMLFDALPLLSDKLYIRKAGLGVGVVMQGKLVPDAALALHHQPVPAASTIELSKEEALAFLRKDTWQGNVPPAGWHLVCFKGSGLGWIKSLGNRVNNYYPKQWRVLVSGK